MHGKDSPSLQYTFNAEDYKSSALVENLKACGKMKDLERGRLLHYRAVELGCHNHLPVANTLISMYSKCGDITHARQIFDGMKHRSVVSWTALILGYVENGESMIALENFKRMDCLPNHVTYVAALKACVGLALSKDTCLWNALSVHRQARQDGLDRCTIVANTLVDVYSKCGDMQRACNVFDEMTHRDVVSWTALITGYVENGQYYAALELFNRMDCFGDRVTFLAAVKACIMLTGTDALDKLQKGMNIHKKAKNLGLDKELVIANSLIDMYSKCGDMRQARRVFDSLGYRDVISWTSLIDGYVENGESLVALDMFGCMDCSPDSITFVSALKACTCLIVSRPLERKLWLEKGMGILKMAREAGFDRDVPVANTFIDMHCKGGNMAQAHDFFDGMVCRNVVSWTAMITGYVEAGMYSEALEMFNNMNCAGDRVTFTAVIRACTGLATVKKLDKASCLHHGTAVHRQVREKGLDKDIVVLNTLLDMYCRCGDMIKAREHFNGMVSHDVVSWNVLLLGYVESNESSVAMDLLDTMDCAPNRTTFIVAIKGCSNIGALKIGQRIHSSLCRHGWDEDQIVATSLVDFYGKCGEMDVAEAILNMMHSVDTVTWNSLISGYSGLGNMAQVFALARRMRDSGLEPDSVTFLLILTAGNHEGMVEDCLRYFNIMSNKYRIKPTVEHYVCIVDILGRANKLEEAFSLLRDMPMKANSSIWMSLLGACKGWANPKIGEAAFNALVALNEDEGSVSAAYVLMRNIYEKLGIK